MNDATHVRMFALMHAAASGIVTPEQAQKESKHLLESRRQHKGKKAFHPAVWIDKTTTKE